MPSYPLTETSSEGPTQVGTYCIDSTQHVCHKVFFVSANSVPQLGWESSSRKRKAHRRYLATSRVEYFGWFHRAVTLCMLEVTSDFYLGNHRPRCCRCKALHGYFCISSIGGHRTTATTATFDRESIRWLSN